MVRRLRSMFFVLVLVILSVNWSGQADPELPLETSTMGRVAPGTGVLLGVLWQLADRRDLADRLVLPALGFALVASLHLLTAGAFTRLTGLFLGLGVLAGLILAEQGLRRSAKVVSDKSAKHEGAAAPP